MIGLFDIDPVDLIKIDFRFYYPSESNSFFKERLELKSVLQEITELSVVENTGDYDVLIKKIREIQKLCNGY
jgi:hypothetical protein